MNWIGLFTVYKKEMLRTKRVAFQTIVSPVITTALYFIVFGSAIGGAVITIDGVSYAQFIVPGLIMMALLQNSFSAASSGIFFPKWSGSIYELLSAPLSYIEITAGYVLAATTRAIIIGLIILGVAAFFTPLPIQHPFVALGFAVLVSFVFALFGFVVGLWATTFEQFNIIPAFVIAPLSFLGGVFYSIEMLPELWQTITLFNPLVYMINGLRWAFYGITDVSIWWCVGVTLAFTLILFGVVAWIFKTGYKLRK